MAKIKLTENGWNRVQDADAKKHILEISCRTENGKVVEARIRHNDGEECVAKVTRNGAAALPMDIKEFETAFAAGELKMD